MTSTKIHIFPITILEQHLDTFGHVNNAAYITLYEQARWEMITEAGCGLEYVQSSGVGPIVLELTTRFKKEIHLRQKLIIKTQVESWGGKIGSIRQWIEDGAGVVYSEGKFTMGLFDIRKRTLVTVDRIWAKAMGLEN